MKKLLIILLAVFVQLVCISQTAILQLTDSQTGKMFNLASSNVLYVYANGSGSQLVTLKPTARYNATQGISDILDVECSGLFEVNTITGRQVLLNRLFVSDLISDRAGNVHIKIETPNRDHNTRFIVVESEASLLTALQPCGSSGAVSESLQFDQTAVIYADSSGSMTGDSTVFYFNGKSLTVIDPVTLSTFIGNDAGFNTTSGSNNIGIGDEALKNAGEIYDIIAIGSDAGWGLEANRGIYIGIQAGDGASANDNIGIGARAGLGASSLAYESVFLGSSSGENSTGNTATAVGRLSALQNSGANLNAIGVRSGLANSGNYGVFFGEESGRSNTGAHVLALGYLAGKNNTQSNRFVLGNDNLPQFAGASAAIAALPAPGVNGVYVYWDTDSNALRVGGAGLSPSAYGLGNKTATALSKTRSVYLSGYATDGTPIEVTIKGEFADDTAAGTGGVLVGQIYYNTTNNALHTRMN